MHRIGEQAFGEGYKFSLLLSFLILIPRIKLTVNGNTNWIHMGGITMQPSEFAKILD
ncbi:MAG: FtsW/RodA/SpoVE family cell cycle protein [Actinomycetota bacterium]